MAADHTAASQDATATGPIAALASTSRAATIKAGGPTAIAQATMQAASGSTGGTAAAIPTRSQTSDATAAAGTVLAGGPAAAEQATRNAAEEATATLPARLHLALGGPTTANVAQTIDFVVALDGPSDIGAFNFDIVYDQRLVTLDAPAANVDALDTPDRQFQCNLPPPSGDIEPDPAVGRARIVCFSFGGAQASAPHAPMALARITVRALGAGSARLRFENVAVFDPSAKGIPVDASDGELTIE